MGRKNRAEEQSVRLSMVVTLSAGIAIQAAVLTAGPAAASGDWGLNGTYIATSNGEWAKTNDIFHNERSVRSTWTISTVCSFPTECSGTVNSDLGWSAPIYQKGGVWFVKRVVPKWEPCPDGSAGDGLQLYRFLESTPDGAQQDPNSNIFVGEDQTTGVAGACGISLPLFITMPFKLVKQG
jgi:hypothetical protein